MAKVTAKKTTEPKKRATAKMTVAGSKSVVKKEVASKSPAVKRTAAKPTAAKRPPRKSAKQPDAREEIRNAALKAAQYALEKKALEVHLLDLTQITSMTDYFVVATGDSDRQVKAIAENVIAEMRDTEGVSPWRSEGWDSLNWVLIDFVDFVVHVFQSEARRYYNIERLWADAPTIEVKDEITKTKTTRKKKVVKEEPEPQLDSRSLLDIPVRVISPFREVGGTSH